MTTIAPEDERLFGTEGFVVEAPEGDLGWVEEVWVGDANTPCALAVRTVDGGQGLLIAKDVLAVDREHHWVVVSTRPALRELSAPRLVAAHDGQRGTFIASWMTTGRVLRPSRRRRPWSVPLRSGSEKVEREPKLWQAVVVLLASIGLIVAVVIALAFLVARLVTGAAY
jgi:hypothetical protein